jgi:hypothetical protein
MLCNMKTISAKRSLLDIYSSNLIHVNLADFASPPVILRKKRRYFIHPHIFTTQFPQILTIMSIYLLTFLLLYSNRQKYKLFSIH